MNEIPLANLIMIVHIYNMAQNDLTVSKNVLFDTTQQKELEYQIAKTLLDSLNEGKITYEEAQNSARFILLQINEYLNQPIKFLELITQKWLLFEPLLKQQTSMAQYKKEDIQKIEDIKKQLLQFA